MARISLSGQWGELGWLSRLFVVAFALGVLSINAVIFYSQLAAAHLGHRGATDLLSLWVAGDEVMRWLTAMIIACCGPLTMILAASIATARRSAA
jgi:hypothetical protein